MEDTSVYALLGLSALIQTIAIAVTVLVLKRAKKVESARQEIERVEPAVSGLERRMNELQRMKFSYMRTDVKIKGSKE